jgi:hypothetical protein
MPISPLPRVAAIALLAVTAALILLELFSRWFAPATSALEARYPIGVIRRPQPYTMFGGLPHGDLRDHHGAVERLNARGYRGPAPAAVKPAGERRVFVVGGSSVFEGRPPLPELLEARLRKMGFTDIRCFNYGVVSSVSGMDLARVVFEVADLEPDMVVMYGGGNDVMSPLLYDPRPGYPFNFLAYENNPVLQRDMRPYPAFTLFAYGSNALRVLAPGFFARRLGGLDDIRREAGYGSVEWREKIAGTYTKHMVKSERVSRAFGARFAAFFQPVLLYKSAFGREEREIAAMLEGVGGTVRDLRVRTRRHLEEARGATGLDVVDLSGIFDLVPDDVFYDYIHVTDRGNQMLAEAMALHVASRLQPVPAGRVARNRSSEAESGR